MTIDIAKLRDGSKDFIETEMAKSRFTESYKFMGHLIFSKLIVTIGVSVKYKTTSKVPAIAH